MKVREDHVRYAMGRYIVKSCTPEGDGPTGSPWRCEARAAGDFGDYRVEIDDEGRFTILNPDGQVVGRDQCCIPVE